MDITGRIIEVLPEESGVSKAGKAWKKDGYILETFDTYPKKVKITVFGRNCDNVHMEAGRAYTVSGWPFPARSAGWQSLWPAACRSTCSFRCSAGRQHFRAERSLRLRPRLAGRSRRQRLRRQLRRPPLLRMFCFSDLLFDCSLSCLFNGLWLTV